MSGSTKTLLRMEHHSTPSMGCCLAPRLLSLLARGDRASLVMLKAGAMLNPLSSSQKPIGKLHYTASETPWPRHAPERPSSSPHRPYLCIPGAEPGLAPMASQPLQGKVTAGFWPGPQEPGSPLCRGKIKFSFKFSLRQQRYRLNFHLLL